MQFSLERPLASQRPRCVTLFRVTFYKKHICYHISYLQCCTCSTSSIINAVQIVCTLGPKSRSVEVLEELLKAGMSVARFNFSHGSHEYHQVPSANMPSNPKYTLAPAHASC